MGTAGIGLGKYSRACFLRLRWIPGCLLLVLGAGDLRIADVGSPPFLVPECKRKKAVFSAMRRKNGLVARSRFGIQIVLPKQASYLAAILARQVGFCQIRPACNVASINGK